MMRYRDYGTVSKLYMRLESICRCALEDLEGIMPEFDPSGDREHSGWQTIAGLEDVLSIVDMYEDALGQIGFGVYFGDAYLGEIIGVKMVAMDIRKIAFALDNGACIGDFRANPKFQTGPPKCAIQHGNSSKSPSGEKEA